MYDNYTFEHINFPFFISYAHGGTGHEFGFTFLSTLFSFRMPLFLLL